MLDYGAIGSRIRSVRTRNHITQEELGEAVGLSAKHISNIENNNARPSIEALVGIANRLDVSVDYLLANDATKMQKFNFQIEFEQIMNGATPKQQLVLMDTLLSYKQILNKHKIK